MAGLILNRITKNVHAMNCKGWVLLFRKKTWDAKKFLLCSKKKVIDVQAFKLEVWSRRYDLNFLFENEEMNQTISRVLRFQRGTQPFENCSQMY